MLENTDPKKQDQYFRTDHLTAGFGARTARGGLVTMGIHGAKFALGIVSTAILARLLSPEDYGLIGMAAVIINFVSIFQDMGLSLATIQRPVITHEQVSTLFWVNVTVSIFVLALVMLIAPVVAWFYDEPRLKMITVVTSFGILIGGLAVQHEALLRRQMKFFALSGIAVTAMTTGYVVGIVFAFYGAHYWSLVFSQLTLLTTNTVGVWLASGWRPGRPLRDSGVKTMLAFGGNVTGYSIINYCSRNVDNLLIGRLMGPAQLGFYSKAIQLLSLPTEQIREPISAVTIPALSRLSQQPERYRQTYLRIMEKVIMLTMPAVALMIVTADWIVYLVLGAQWAESAWILIFLGISGLFQPIFGTSGWLLATQDRTRHMLYWSMINAPISIISIIVGVEWGVLGVAASYSLARLLITTPLMFWFVGRTGPVRTVDFYRLLAPFTCASCVAMMACLLFRKYIIIDSPLVGFVSSAFLVSLATLSVLCLLPRGRSALFDLKASLLLIKSERRATRGSA